MSAELASLGAVAENVVVKAAGQQRAVGRECKWQRASQALRIVKDKVNQ